MGQIKILDTGYVRPTNAGTQASSGNRANSGSAISLKTAEFIPSLKRNYQADPNIGTNSPSEVNLGTLENMQFTLRCILDTKTASDMAITYHLLNLLTTNGYKVMWYDYTTATPENNNGQLIYQIALNPLFGHVFTSGEQTAFSISTGFYHLHVLFNEMLPKHSGDKSLIFYDLSGIVLKVEASTV